MILAALLIVQTLPGAAPEPGSALSAVAKPCAAGPDPDGPDPDGGVIVCGRRRDADRLTPLPAPAPGQHPDPLAFRLPGGGSGRVAAFQREFSGAISQGVAVTVAIPLGRRRRADGEVR